MMMSTVSLVSDKSIRIVFDTNVLISAAVTAGIQASYALDLVQRGDLVSFTSEAILHETEEKLLEKFGYETQEARKFVTYIRRHSFIVQPTHLVFNKLRDPNDLHVIGTAVAAQADLIITSDRDLLFLKRFEKIGIVHPKTLQWLFPKLSS